MPPVAEEVMLIDAPIHTDVVVLPEHEVPVSVTEVPELTLIIFVALDVPHTVVTE